jgi:hypothetical protein
MKEVLSSVQKKLMCIEMAKHIPARNSGKQ